MTEEISNTTPNEQRTQAAPSQRAAVGGVMTFNEIAPQVSLILCGKGDLVSADLASHWSRDDALLICVWAGALTLKPTQCAQDLTLEAGTGCLQSVQIRPQETVFAKTHDTRFVVVAMPQKFLQTLFTNRCADAQPGSSCTLCTVCMRQFQIPPDLMSVLHQLLETDLHVALRGLFHVAKTYELVTLALDHLCQVRHHPSLSCQDIQSLRRARAVLDERMAAPPSLIELARLVGINDFKLKKGFKELFQMTPYSYLTSQRMAHARKVLMDDDAASVTEVASRVGYTNLGHFAAAFRKKYGVAPREYRKFAKRGMLINSRRGSNGSVPEQRYPHLND